MNAVKVMFFFLQLRILTKVKNFLSPAEFERVIYACMSSCLYYCNSIYIGIGQSYMNRMKIVQNAAARLLTGTCKYEHITLILLSLHWLSAHWYDVE